MVWWNFLKTKTKNNTPTFRTAFKKNFGEYLTDSYGRALYCNTGDNIKTMHDDIEGIRSDFHLGIWQGFYKDKLNIQAPFKKEDFCGVVRPNGQKQIAYKNYPIYYYANDLEPRDTNGEGINNQWFLVKMN
jgi:hypothetical protein